MVEKVHNLITESTRYGLIGQFIESLIQAVSQVLIRVREQRSVLDLTRSNDQKTEKNVNFN